VELRRRYNPSAPKGVRGRSSDNALIQERLGWQPSTSLEQGLEVTYRWILEEMTASWQAPVATSRLVAAAG